MFLNVNQLRAFYNSAKFKSIIFAAQRLMVTPEYTVATAKGALQIHGLEVSDKRLMSWETFIKERYVKPGDRFQTIH